MIPQILLRVGISYLKGRVLLVATEDGIIGVEITAGIGHCSVKVLALWNSYDEMFRLSLSVEVKIVDYAHGAASNSNGLCHCHCRARMQV